MLDTDSDVVCSRQSCTGRRGVDSGAAGARTPKHERSWALHQISFEGQALLTGLPRVCSCGSSAGSRGVDSGAAGARLPNVGRPASCTATRGGRSAACAAGQLVPSFQVCFGLELVMERFMVGVCCESKQQSLALRCNEKRPLAGACCRPTCTGLSGEQTAPAFQCVVCCAATRGGHSLAHAAGKYGPFRCTSLGT